MMTNNMKRFAASVGFQNKVELLLFSVAFFSLFP